MRSGTRIGGNAIGTRIGRIWGMVANFGNAMAHGCLTANADGIDGH